MLTLFANAQLAAYREDPAWAPAALNSLSLSLSPSLLSSLLFSSLSTLSRCLAERFAVQSSHGWFFWSWSDRPKSAGLKLSRVGRD